MTYTKANCIKKRIPCIKQILLILIWRIARYR